MFYILFYNTHTHTHTPKSKTRAKFFRSMCEWL